MIGQSGTLESNDILVTVTKKEQAHGIKIDLESVVLARYGNQIHGKIMETLNEFNVENVSVIAVDKGALDSTIRARVLSACDRAGLLTEV